MRPDTAAGNSLWVALQDQPEDAGVYELIRKMYGICRT
jgi:hypothetical protein